MLDDIRLTQDQLKLLRHAAGRAGFGRAGELREAYRGAFCPANSATCVGFRGDYEDLLVFYAVVDAHDPALGGILRARRCFDGTWEVGRDPATFYWPGVLAA